jgi:hypothetical protein
LALTPVGNHLDRLAVTAIAPIRLTSSAARLGPRCAHQERLHHLIDAKFHNEAIYAMDWEPFILISRPYAMNGGYTPPFARKLRMNSRRFSLKLSPTPIGNLVEKMSRAACESGATLFVPQRKFAA